MDTQSYLPEPDALSLGNLSLGTAVLCYGWHDPSVIAACAQTANVVVAGGQTLEYADPEEIHHYRAVTRYLESKNRMPTVLFSVADALELTRFWTPDTFGLSVIDPWQNPTETHTLIGYALALAPRVALVDRGRTLDPAALVRASGFRGEVNIVTTGSLRVIATVAAPMIPSEVS